jgi:hypothetical protein
LDCPFKEGDHWGEIWEKIRIERDRGKESEVIYRANERDGKRQREKA